MQTLQKKRCNVKVIIILNLVEVLILIKNNTTGYHWPARGYKLKLNIQDYSDYCLQIWYLNKTVVIQ